MSDHQRLSGASNDLDLFNLPRELRDSIYDEVIDNGKILITCHEKPLVRVRNFLDQNLTRVSKQFGEELLQRHNKPEVFVIQDHPHNQRRNLRPGLFYRYYHITHVELHLALSCRPACHEELSGRDCHVFTDLKMHRELLESVCVMENVRSVSISFYLRPHKFVAYCEQGLIDQLPLAGEVFQNLCSLARSGRLSGLDFYRSDFDGGYWNFANSRTLVMTYFQETQVLKYVHNDNEGRQIQGYNSVRLGRD